MLVSALEPSSRRGVLGIAGEGDPLDVDERAVGDAELDRRCSRGHDDIAREAGAFCKARCTSDAVGIGDHRGIFGRPERSGPSSPGLP